MRIDDIVLSSSETCHFYSITKTTLTNWTAKGFPKIGRNKYPLKAGHDFWTKNIIGEEAGELQNEKLKFQRARTRREELKVLQEEGLLIPKNQSITWLSTLVTNAKIGFLGLPRRLAEQLASMEDRVEIEVLLRREIRNILEELSQDGKKALKEKS